MRHVAPWVIHQPKITYYQAQRAWFYYQNKMYSISTAQTPVFKAAVREIAPITGRAMHALFLQKELDMIERWYILCSVTNGVYPLKLFYTERRKPIDD